MAPSTHLTIYEKYTKIYVVLKSQKFIPETAKERKYMWETVSEKPSCQRMEVPEGWIVMTISSFIPGRSMDGGPTIAMTFVPDLGHVWELNKLDPKSDLKRPTRGAGPE